MCKHPRTSQKALWEQLDRSITVLQQIKAPERIQSQIDVTSFPLLVPSNQGRTGACLLYPQRSS